MLNLVALSGSLRAASINSMLLRATTRLAPPGVAIHVFNHLGEFPLFNPDIEYTNPTVVTELKNLLVAADGVLIASPEYAHGVSGVLKNALDWMVGCEAFVYKSVALYNASPRAVHAYAALKETLNVMSALIIEEASITVPLLGSQLDENRIIEHPALSALIRESLISFQHAILRHQRSTSD